MKLDEFFAEHPKAALAFSGGTDSAFLLYAARSAGADVKGDVWDSVPSPAENLRFLDFPLMDFLM